jgi:hypothetical protein
MNKSKIMWLVGLVLGGYGFYSLFLSYEFASWPSAAWSCVAIIGGLGLIMNKKWSQYFVYLYAAAMIYSWSYSAYSVVQQGWPYPDTKSTIISLIPGMFLLTLCAASSIAVFLYFKNENA